MHFRRKPLLDVLVSRTDGSQPGDRPGIVTADLAWAACHRPDEVLAVLESGPQGLDAAQVRARQDRDGPNDIGHEAPVPIWMRLWHGYLNPFNLLLTVLALLSWLGMDLEATLVIGTMVALSTLVRFVQEERSHRSAGALQALVSTTATVMREPVTRWQEIAQRDLVAGDRIALAAGDMVPADARLLDARDLFLSESALTGEALPVEKFVAPGPAGTPALAQRNLVFMGTNVVSGTATAVVVCTGERSWFGALAASTLDTEVQPGTFLAGVNSVSWMLIRFAMTMAPLVFLISGLTRHDWLEAFLFSLSVAVGLTPEMLPMIVTSTLARGAVRLARRKVVVKRLDAIQNFGAMDVLCTDKTGTLTQDRIALSRHTDAFGTPSEAVLSLAALNSRFQTGLKNLLDRAVLEHVDLGGGDQQGAELARKIDEIPFDFQRRRMSVLVAQPGDGLPDRHELICKGAVEEVLTVCDRVRMSVHDGGGERRLDAELLARTLACAGALNREGLRVVAVAVRTLPPSRLDCTVADEAGLTLVGYIGFLDPPRDSAAPALRRLAGHGIQVKVLTGDNALVTEGVCRQVGLPPGPILLGTDIEAMSDAELQAEAARHHLFAKLDPMHKQRIVRALRAGGHVVGFLGDGINDAPALRAADIGISVDSAVDIAREAADIILLEKSLLVLDDGVIEGRTTFCNMLKYIRMTTSSSFGNVLSVLLASAFLPFLPMLPLQLLVQNLMYDISQTALPFDRVDDDLLERPLAWNPSGIGRFMLCFGPVSSVFDLATFALMWWVFGADDPTRQSLFQSGWFVAGLLTQTLVVHLLRTPRIPFVQSRASATLLAMTAAIVVAGVWLPMGPLASHFRLQALPAAYFGWLGLILLGYGMLATLVKRIYIRRFGWQ
ncbi:magnesium-translocating P-type ATPase [Sphaerotilus natans]|uniref:magnesium-translocating P-type ATPase n=1 Tax=Sphaerotilus natans TaxID=34103 RepID=UPI00406BFC55